MLLSGCVPLGWFAQGSNLPPLTPKMFFSGPITANIWHGSEDETSLIVNDSSVNIKQEIWV